MRMVDACFTATVTTVDPGTPVTFVNRDDGITHNVGGHQWGQFEDMLQGDAFTVSFDEAGIYPFACTYHPGMTGAIVVGDGKGAGPAGVTVEPLARPRLAAVTRVVTESDATRQRVARRRRRPSASLVAPRSPSGTGGGDGRRPRRG